MIFAPFSYQQRRVVAAGGGGATPTPTPTRTLTPTPTPSAAAANKWNYTDILTTSVVIDCGTGEFAFYQERTITFYLYQSNCSTLQTSHPYTELLYDLEVIQFGVTTYYYDNVITLDDGQSSNFQYYTATDGCVDYTSTAFNFRNSSGLVKCP